MTAPRLIPLNAPAAHLSSPDARLFGVVEGGDFEGLRVEAGEILECRPVPEPSGPVVLEARFGRPRLGRQQGHALTGDGGEACSPLRWRVVGEIVAVLRGVVDGSGGPLFAVEPGLRVVSDEKGRPPGGRARRTHAWASPQLDLFGGACAA